MKNSEIKFNIQTDENHIPESISWTAEDGGINNEEAKTILLSIWDAKTKETLRIDLWTKDMPVDEMKIFFHQTLTALSDTFRRATGEDKMADSMLDFSNYFAEKLELKS